ncbi:Protein translocase subunit [Frankliniella fusca]|uniref:Protein translocase subunit n=1 Tax=Frankliniella fusca TaxID=407009 RepID=A0AAE1I009_9NEOP|nr:Protein translocase subunit [Frankliniella fusca]
MIEVIGNNEREISNPSEIVDNVVINPEMLTGQFIPIDLVLKGFLEINGVLPHILSYMDLLSSEVNILENVVQGDLWRKKIKPMFGDKIVFPVSLNFDDYEPDNALGSHAGVHKLGAAYLEISCLPPQFQGALKNKFLALLFHSSDRYVGNDSVFRPLLNILKLLETEGVIVVTSSGVFQIYFALTLILGDNLGLHGILGFMEGFCANFPCRICRANKTVVRKQVVSDLSLLRNKENYADVLVNDGSLTGVNEECVFNRLKTFHVTENLSVDIMHDVLEGAFKYDMCSIINYLTRRQFFDYETLNDRVQAFVCGSSEYGNRPPIIQQESVVNEAVNFSASEMLFLVRYFGLIVGDMVPEDNPVWKFYLVMLSILDILCSPSVSLVEIKLLDNFISKHHTMYIDLFQQHLKPKHHFMLHYSFLIRLLGPLIRIWCMRFESKHREGKLYAQVSCNRTNLPKSISIKHQLKLCFRFLTQSGLVQNFDYPTLDLYNSLENSENFCEIRGLVPDFVRSWCRVKWLTTNSVKYSVGMVLVIALDKEFPVFGIIHSILVNDQSKDELKTVHFDEHVHAYQVHISNVTWGFVALSELITYLPSIVRVLESKHYVTCRHIL